MYAEKEKIQPANVSKHNSKREKQVIHLVISDGKKWHYLAVKKLSALLRGITSKHQGDVYCLNCFYSFATENKLQSHKRACQNKEFCKVNTASEETKILEFNQHQKSDKTPFIF